MPQNFCASWEFVNAGHTLHRSNIGTYSCRDIGIAHAWGNIYNGMADLMCGKSAECYANFRYAYRQKNPCVPGEDSNAIAKLYCNVLWLQWLEINRNTIRLTACTGTVGVDREESDLIVQALRQIYPNTEFLDWSDFPSAFGSTQKKSGIMIRGGFEVPSAWYWTTLYHRLVTRYGYNTLRNLIELSDEDNRYNWSSPSDKASHFNEWNLWLKKPGGFNHTLMMFGRSGIIYTYRIKGAYNEARQESVNLLPYMEIPNERGVFV